MVDDEDDELTRDNNTAALPSLPPLPPLLPSSTSSPSSSFTTTDTYAHAKTRPVGKVQPFLVDIATPEREVDPSELTLKSLPPLPPRSSSTLCQPKVSTLEDEIFPPKPPIIKTHPPFDNVPDPTRFPPDKRWHMFISHSTSDEQFVKESLIIPLEDACRRVSACFRYMSHDHSKYNDHDIKVAMKESCVIMIGLSRAYCNSGRCVKEMNSILSFSNRGECMVVVAAFESCSRPLEIKKFLYLDFIDRTKRGNVWIKLEETINSAVSIRLQHTSHGSPSPPSLPPLFQPSSSGEGGGGTATRYSNSPTINSERSSSVMQMNYDYDFDEALQDMRQKGDVSGFDFPPLEEKEREDSLRGEVDSEEGHSDEEHSRSEGDSERENFEGELDFEGGLHFEDTQGDIQEDDDDEDRFSNAEMFGNESFDEDFAYMYKGGVVNKMGLVDHDQSDNESNKEEGMADERGVVSESMAIKRKRSKEEYEEGELSSDEDQLPHQKQQVTKLISEREGTEEGKECEEEEGELGDLEQSQKVQDFYDKLAEPGADKRNESPILYMRGFNNWVKSILIRTYLPSSATVLDLCCGKGGDLNKWKEGKIKYFVGADISEASVEHAKGRYNDKKMRNYATGRPVFDGEFITADCCQVQLRNEYSNPGKRFDMTSCQFSLHYAFESYEKASMMLQNACENLLPGGYFIGTTVDANELVSRLRHEGKQNEEGYWTISNNVFSVTFDKDFNPNDKSTLPLFGCKYHFQLAGVVNVPEFLLHYPLLVHMLKKWGMMEVLHQNFYDFFAEHKCIPEDLTLLYRMQAFNRNSGTMTPDEWETIGLYLVFVFQKVTTPHTLSHDHSSH